MANPAWPTEPAREIREEELRAYRRDGAVALRGVLDARWIERMRAAIERVLAAPGPSSREYTAAGAPGRYFGEMFVWRRDADFRAFMADSPMPPLAARMLGSKSVRFFYDQLLVKEPGTAEATPWHHDLPYWPLRGQDIVSIWVPFDSASAETGVVRYVRGSHLWGRRFAPASFSQDSGFAEVYRKSGLEPVPDIDRTVAAADILCWELAPGDVLIHHPLTVHHASGNASASLRRRGLALRYVGDDAVYDTRPGTFLENANMRAHLPEIALRDGEPLHGELFPQVWPRPVRN